MSRSKQLRAAFKRRKLANKAARETRAVRREQQTHREVVRSGLTFNPETGKWNDARGQTWVIIR